MWDGHSFFLYSLPRNHCTDHCMDVMLLSHLLHKHRNDCYWTALSIHINMILIMFFMLHNTQYLLFCKLNYLIMTGDSIISKGFH